MAESETGIPVFSSVKEAKTSVAADAAVIATPSFAHADNVRECLKNRLHVLVEKPFTLDINEARRLVEDAESEGLVLLVSQNYRYHTETCAARNAIRSGKLGKVEFVQIQGFNLADMNGVNYRCRLHNPHLWEMAVHQFDLIRFLFDCDVERVFCTLFNPSWSWYKDSACTHAWLELSNDARVNYMGTYVTRGPESTWDNSWRIEGTDGTILLNELPDAPLAYVSGPKAKPEILSMDKLAHENLYGTLAEMQATAAWQAAWGVTEFTLYYGITGRSAETYRAYCDYVGRLNAVLKPARPAPRVLLYYPIHDLWAEYRPVAERLRIESQSARAQRIVTSFMQLGRMLQRNQVPFVVIDHEGLAAARVGRDGTLVIKGQCFQSLILPDQSELPQEAAQVVERFRRKGGILIADNRDMTMLSAEMLIEKMKLRRRLLPASERIVLGEFLRDGRRILLVVNVGRKPYSGQIATEGDKVWHVMDPATGLIKLAECDKAGQLPLSLAARQALILLEHLPAPPHAALVPKSHKRRKSQEISGCPSLNILS